jgi:ribosomal-protein-alanine N-acetyltransferase
MQKTHFGRDGTRPQQVPFYGILGCYYGLHMQRTTQRIILCAATIELLEAELTSLASLGRLLNATIPSGWPPGEYDRKAQEFFLERMREGFDQPAGWYSWYAIHPNAGSHTLIGAAGFIGPPDKEGLVQIGFSIHPHWQRLGFATELAAELVAFAFEHDSVRSIIGDTTRRNVASCKSLSRLGFLETEGNRSHEEVRFLLRRASAPV